MTPARHVLPNGLRLITIPMKDNPTVTVMVLVEAGSKYETKETNGISHFLEHLCFKGTARRPKPIDIARELDSIGAQYNAFTSQEFTGYFAKSDRRHLDTILDVVSDIYLNPVFPEAEIEKEKGVIAEEIKMYRDLPPKHIGDVLLSLLYGDQPAGFGVAGTEETVRRLTREDIADYKQRHYLSGATCVIVAGAVGDAEALEKVSRVFAAMKSGPKHPKTAVVEGQEAPALRVEHRATDQVHLLFGIRAFDTYHKDLFALRILTALLGGGMSSRLFQKMREELGICYYVHAGSEAYTDHGYLDIAAGVPTSRLFEALRTILHELLRLRANGISPEELAHTKKYLAGNLHLSLESSDSLAEFFGFQEIVRKPLLSPDAMIAGIRAVTAEDVARIASSIFKDERLNLALIGPVAGSDSLTEILHL